MLKKPEEILKEIVITANHELIKAAQSDVKLEGMGTTLVVATVIGNTCIFFKCRRQSSVSDQ